MSFELNDKVLNIEPYDPIKGNYRIRLDANESFLNPPANIQKEIAKAVTEAAFNRYPDPNATEVCKMFAKYYGINSELVTAGNGSDELISVIMNAFLEKGDKVLTLSPDFSMYRFYTRIVECPCVIFEKNKDFSVDVDRLIKTAEREKVRLIIFSNPCNPTSVGMSADDVRKLIKGVDALVVLDEAYMDFWEQSLLSEVEEYDNLIILRTCSKAIGLAAIRLGFAIANKKITDLLHAVKSPYNVNSITQAIATIILSHPDYIKYCIAKIKYSRESLYKQFKQLEEEYPDKIRVLKTVTNFLYINFDNSSKLFEKLISQGIVVRLMGDYLRITAGSDYENSEIIKAIRKFI